jgi:maleate isomerase
MLGWRTRIGVLVPPGNPTVEPELYRMTPRGVSVHFARMDSTESASAPGAPAGMEDRTRAYIDSLPGPARTLAAVNPAVVVLAFTAASYANGFKNEETLSDRIAALTGTRAVTAAEAIFAALRHLHVKKLAPRDALSGVDQRHGKGVLGVGRISDCRIPAAGQRREHLRRE